MGKDWVNDLLKQRTSGLQKQEQDARLSLVAQSHAAGMFKRLCSQIQQDAQMYSQGSGKALVCTLQDNTCEVKYDKFPHFWLQVSFGRSEFTVIETRKKSSSAQQSRTVSTILLIGKAQDEVYYRIDGEDYASESDVSEHLLRPLLESID